MTNISLVAEEVVQNKIMIIRGKKVLLDKDIALLYEVTAIALRQQVKRNLDRFPEDFMFILNDSEVEIMVSQNVIPSKKYLGGSLPYVFTEQGIAMLSSVLTSTRSIQVNIQIMRTFAKIREIMGSSSDLRKKIEDLEKRYDQNFTLVFKAIKHLLSEPEDNKMSEKKNRIGFN